MSTLDLSISTLLSSCIINPLTTLSLAANTQACYYKILNIMRVVQTWSFRTIFYTLVGLSQPYNQNI